MDPAFNDPSPLLIQLPLWLSVLLLAFVVAGQHYRRLCSTLASSGTGLAVAAAIVPAPLLQSVLPWAAWWLVLVLAWTLAGRGESSDDAGMAAVNDVGDPPLR